MPYKSYFKPSQIKSTPTTVTGCLTAPSHTLLKGASRITPEGGEPIKNVDRLNIDGSGCNGELKNNSWLQNHVFKKLPLSHNAFATPPATLKKTIATSNRVHNFFQDFSRTQIDFSRALRFTSTPTLPRSQVNFPSCLPHNSYLSVESNRFPELSRPFSGLSSPGKCRNKIPGFSRFSRTHTNPE